MNYEERYKQAIEAAKRELHCCGSLDCDAARQIFRFFPELRESEDERIRKKLINFFSKGAEYDSSTNGIKDRNIIAWLEKQDTKFQEYINEERNKKDFYCEGKEMSWNEMPLTVRKHDYPYYFKGDLDCYPFNVEKQGEQNPSWSEEDEDVINHLLAICAGAKKYRQFAGCLQEDITKYQTWLKFLKDRVQPQTTSEWSEEDEEMFDAIIADIKFTQKAHNNDVNQVVYEEEIDWLKSIKDRVQSKQEWGEYDKIQLSEAIQMVEANGTWIRSEDAVKKVSNWLKSIKPHWKPSEEQLEALWDIISHIPNSERDIDTITELSALYEELKNL